MTPDTEAWLPIPDWEGYYEVSDHGNVRSVDRTIVTVDGRISPLRGQPIKAHLNDRTGYPFVRLTRNSKAINVACHRLVALAFIGPPPPGTEVCHEDGDRLNPRLDNLRWDTRTNNILDAVKHGTYRNGCMNKTHCKRGHEFTEANTHISPTTGDRRCRTCSAMHTRASRARHQKLRAA